MPVYDYRCQSCGRRQTHFLRSYSELTPVCSHCGSNSLQKLVSRFATFKSEESRLESLTDPSVFSGLDENDPRSMARWARKMAESTGEDLGEEFHEIVERMEAGEMPEEAPGEGAAEALD